MAEDERFGLWQGGLMKAEKKKRHSGSSGKAMRGGKGMVFVLAVGGIKVFITPDELQPTAQEYGEHYIAVYGLVEGMAVMAVSLLMFL